jgi:uncharacterized protein (DUF2141 family)
MWRNKWKWIKAMACVPLMAHTIRYDVGLSITITGLRNNKGYVLISLFSSSAGFPDKPEKAIRRAKITAGNKSSVCIFTGLPTGMYAVAILHDENGDQKMNTNFFGIPKEGYGFSNNVMGSMGPPSYRKASFSYSEGAAQNISIKTRYGF